MKNQHSFNEFLKMQFLKMGNLFRIRNSLKKKFIVVFILIILVLGAISFGTYYVMDSSVKKLNRMIDASLTVNTVIGETKNICDATEENGGTSYMSSYMMEASSNPSSEKSLKFKKGITDSLARIEESIDILDKEYVADNSTKNTLNQTKTIFGNFKKDVLSSLEKFEKQDTSAASSAEQVNRSGNYLASYTQNVMSGILAESTRQKELLKKQSDLTGRIVMLAILLVAVLSAVTAYLFTGRITKTIRQLADSSMNVAEGNLKVEIIQSRTRDEIALLTKSFQTMTENLRQLIQEITGSTQKVSQASILLKTGAEQNSKAIEQIAANTQQVSFAASGQSEKSKETVDVIQEVLGSSKKIQRNTDLLQSSSAMASNAANTGNEKMQNLLEQISKIEVKFSDTQNSTEELKGKAGKIGRAMEAISRIASQTNLLSLNASIEAARAGVYGKSFAVVAEEIRKLAVGSADAASEITGILKEIQAQSEQVAESMTSGVNEVKEGTLLASEARKTFDEIIGTSAEVQEKVRLIMDEINTMAMEIEKVEFISRGISDSANRTYESTCDVAAAIEEQSASLQEILTSSIELSDMAERLQNSTQQFKL